MKLISCENFVRLSNILVVFIFISLIIVGFVAQNETQKESKQPQQWVAHPMYISTRTGFAMADLPVVQVQHHHAHIASCMAENMLDEKVIGVAFDGTGFGTDGNTWGSEFLICDLADFERITYFEYIPLPGGDSATEEPWRTAVSYLYKVYGIDFLDLKLNVIRKTDQEKIRMIAIICINFLISCN